MTLRALLFDMDGTVIDSDPIHVEVFIAFMAEYGLSISRDDYMSRIHGRRNEEVFAEVLPDQDPWALHEAKEARFRARLGPEQAPMPGLVPLLERARAAGWRCALVTNACRENAIAVLATLKLNAYFDAVILAEDHPRGKPDPAVYRAALEALQVSADEALAFEDSSTGLASATGAGIRTIGISSGLSPDTLRLHGAHTVIADFTDPALEPLLGAPKGTSP